ncbi:MAG: uL22 family ribosomal protein [Candidatus Nanoarchaeia archaeon]|nr:uL22 family ribosomal protein [Candidatus Nanoarchaeia archaeon]MDD5588442.1 uL22 family ribosomal protein [Candidatus Nanoarchaeia archaeon]
MTEKNYNPEQGKAKTVKQETPKMKAEAPAKKETKADDKAEKKTIVKKQIVKKDEAIVNGVSVPISTKDAIAICNFIKRKSIDKALADLDDVVHFKRAIPMTGEIPHRKGKGMMSGRYPIRAIGHFTTMLKTLKANANVNGVEEPIIVEAVPNKASRPYGRFGAIKRKRTHVKIRVVEKNKLKNKEKKK